MLKNEKCQLGVVLTRGEKQLLKQRALDLDQTVSALIRAAVAAIIAPKDRAR